jgi:hypothetical protein
MLPGTNGDIPPKVGINPFDAETFDRKDVN